MEGIAVLAADVFSYTRPRSVDRVGAGGGVVTGAAGCPYVTETLGFPDDDIDC